MTTVAGPSRTSPWNKAVVRESASTGRGTHLVHPGQSGFQRRLREEELDRAIHLPIRCTIRDVGRGRKVTSTNAKWNEGGEDGLVVRLDGAFPDKLRELTTYRRRLVSSESLSASQMTSRTLRIFNPARILLRSLVDEEVNGVDPEVRYRREIVILVICRLGSLHDRSLDYIV